MLKDAAGRYLTLYAAPGPGGVHLSGVPRVLIGETSECRTLPPEFKRDEVAVAA